MQEDRGASTSSSDESLDEEEIIKEREKLLDEIRKEVKSIGTSLSEIKKFIGANPNNFFSSLLDQLSLENKKLLFLEQSINGNIVLLELLLKKRVDIDSQNSEGNTALILTARTGDVKTVRWLLDNRANLNIKNNNKKGALQIAKESNQHDVVYLIQQVKKEIDKNINSPSQKDSTFFSVVDNNLLVDMNNWVLSVLYAPKEATFQHTYLLVEGLNQSYKAILRRYELLSIPKESSVAGACVRIKEVSMSPEKSPTTFEKEIAKERCDFLSFCLTRKQAEKLHEDIIKDQNFPPRYQSLGDKSVVASLIFRKGHNSFTWIREKLNNLNLEYLRIGSSIFDNLIALPNLYKSNEMSKQEEIAVHSLDRKSICSQDNIVVVRIWTSHKRGVLSKIFDLNHVSMEVKQQYISLWPEQGRKIWKPVPAKFVQNLETDLVLMDKPPDQVICLYSLDNTEITREFNQLKTMLLKWRLFSPNFFMSKDSESTTSFIYRLLIVGGIKQLLLSKILTMPTKWFIPDNILKILVQAKLSELNKFPETKNYHATNETPIVDLRKKVIVNVAKSSIITESLRLDCDVWVISIISTSLKDVDRDTYIVVEGIDVAERFKLWKYQFMIDPNYRKPPYISIESEVCLESVRRYKPMLLTGFIKTKANYKSWQIPHESIKKVHMSILEEKQSREKFILKQSAIFEYNLLEANCQTWAVRILRSLGIITSPPLMTQDREAANKRIEGENATADTDIKADAQKIRIQQHRKSGIVVQFSSNESKANASAFIDDVQPRTLITGETKMPYQTTEALIHAYNTTPDNNEKSHLKSLILKALSHFSKNYAGMYSPKGLIRQIVKIGKAEDDELYRGTISALTKAVDQIECLTNIPALKGLAQVIYDHADEQQLKADELNRLITIIKNKVRADMGTLSAFNTLLDAMVDANSPIADHNSQVVLIDKLKALGDKAKDVHDYHVEYQCHRAIQALLHIGVDEKKRKSAQRRLFALLNAAVSFGTVATSIATTVASFGATAVVLSAALSNSIDGIKQLKLAFNHKSKAVWYQQIREMQAALIALVFQYEKPNLSQIDDIKKTLDQFLFQALAFEVKLELIDTLCDIIQVHPEQAIRLACLDKVMFYSQVGLSPNMDKRLTSKTLKYVKNRTQARQDLALSQQAINRLVWFQEKGDTDLSKSAKRCLDQLRALNRQQYAVYYRQAKENIKLLSQSDIASDINLAKIAQQKIDEAETTQLKESVAKQQEMIEVQYQQQQQMITQLEAIGEGINKINDGVDKVGAKGDIKQGPMKNYKAFAQVMMEQFDNKLDQLAIENRIQVIEMSYTKENDISENLKSEVESLRATLNALKDQENQSLKTLESRASEVNRSELTLLSGIKTQGGSFQVGNIRVTKVEHDIEAYKAAGLTADQVNALLKQAQEIMQDVKETILTDIDSSGGGHFKVGNIDVEGVKTKDLSSRKQGSRTFGVKALDDADDVKTKDTKDTPSSSSSIAASQALFSAKDPDKLIKEFATRIWGVLEKKLKEKFPEPWEKLDKQKFKKDKKEKLKKKLNDEGILTQLKGIGSDSDSRDQISFHIAEKLVTHCSDFDLFSINSLRIKDGIFAFNKEQQIQSKQLGNV